MKSIFALIVFACFCSTLRADEYDAARLFSQLKDFEGEWRITEPSRDTIVTFEVIASGSAVVERWTMSPTRTSMTVYALDGDDLIVTHYCPQENAPRLKLVRTDSNGIHRFSFLDGLNLQDKEGSHQHAFWMQVKSSSQFVRGETYIKNGSEYVATEDLKDPQTFVRVAAKK